MRNPLGMCDLMLRDGHQSLLATRMRTDDMLPIAEKIDQVGYWAVEMWGGATFDSAMRFLGENPWDRIRRLKEHMPNTEEKPAPSGARQISPVVVMSPLPVASIATTRPMVPSSTFSSLWEP